MWDGKLTNKKSTVKGHLSRCFLNIRTIEETIAPWWPPLFGHRASSLLRHHREKLQIPVAVVDEAVGVALGAVMAGAGDQPTRKFAKL